MKKALLVVDMQNIYLGKDHAKFFTYNNNVLIENVNERISKYNKEDVIYIINIMKDNFINKFIPFKAYEGTKEVELVENLLLVNEVVISKYKGDAFSNPKLKQILDSREVQELEIIGIDGGGCVALTALGASENGYDVSIYTNAVGTIFEKRAAKLNKKLRKKGVKFI